MIIENWQNHVAVRLVVVVRTTTVVPSVRSIVLRISVHSLFFSLFTSHISELRDCTPCHFSDGTLVLPTASRLSPLRFCSAFCQPYASLSTFSAK